MALAAREGLRWLGEGRFAMATRFRKFVTKTHTTRSFLRSTIVSARAVTSGKVHNQKATTERRSTSAAASQPTIFKPTPHHRTSNVTDESNIKNGSKVEANTENNVQLTVAQRVQRRVDERNGWSTWCSGGGIFKFIDEWRHSTYDDSGPPSAQLLAEHYPITQIDFDRLRNPPIDEIQCTWVGHSTLIVQMGGFTIITDPIFSDRCSLFQWVGPIRHTPPATSVQQLYDEGVKIDLVLVSHNHFDHLDYQSVNDLAEIFHPKFVVPLGLETWFESYCPRALEHGIVSLDWHESTSIVENVVVTAVPMQHWTMRHPLNRNETLWCGYAVSCTHTNLSTKPNSDKEAIDVDTNTATTINPNTSTVAPTTSATDVKHKFLFSGDTGWFDGLHDIGNVYGPFDLAAIPIGAYSPRHFLKKQHVDPESAVRMMQVLRATQAVPIHYGTFKLAAEPFCEPIKLLRQTTQQMGVTTFDPWNIGDTIETKKTKAIAN
eukprot:m.170546 g.170546  ORF g.170546 m.170546 type:complete len:490 (-) comp31612_c1_seq1:53-1522(-)